MLKLPSEPNEITTIYSAWEGGVCMRVGGGCKVSIVGETQKYKRRLVHRLDKINFSRCVNILKQELLTG